jgi:hypothetical protein
MCNELAFISRGPNLPWPTLTRTHTHTPHTKHLALSLARKCPHRGFSIAYIFCKHQGAHTHNTCRQLTQHDTTQSDCATQGTNWDRTRHGSSQPAAGPPAGATAASLQPPRRQRRRRRSNTCLTETARVLPTAGLRAHYGWVVLAAAG